MFKWLRKKEKTITHPMIGKVYKLKNDNPFKDYFVRVTDIKQNDNGIEWVKFSMIFENGIVYAKDFSEKLDVFLYCYRGCEV